MRARCVGVASRSACGCVGVGCCSGGAASARLGLVLVSARASTGRLAGALAGVSGCGLRGAQGSTFVRWDLEDSWLATGSRHQCRSARVSAHEGRIVGALGGGVGSASPFSWHGPREGRSAAPADPLSGGFSTAGAVLRLRIHRWHTHTQILASSASEGPRTRAAAAPSRPVEALSERRTSRSRADAAPPEREAAPTQPQDEREAAPTQPHRSTNPRRRSPPSSTSRTDAAAGREKPHRRTRWRGA